MGKAKAAIEYAFSTAMVDAPSIIASLSVATVLNSTNKRTRELLIASRQRAEAILHAIRAAEAALEKDVTT